MASIKRCTFCARELTPGKSTCDFCKALQTKSSGRGNDNRYGTSIKLSEVKADDTKRIASGPWDYVFGETLDNDANVVSSGVAIGSANLLGGEPGAGKSTLALHMAASIANTCINDEYVLYIATEENPVSIAARARRLKLENIDKIRIEDFSKGDKCCWEYIESLSVKPKVLFVDSTDKLSTDLSDELSHLGVIAHSLNITMIYIHHVNKQFAFTGAMNIQHLVDGTFALVCLGDKDDTRELASIKNRNGKAKENIKFTMDDDGLHTIPEYDKLKFGDLPSKDDYISRIGDDEELFIETEDENDLEIDSKENAWKMLETVNATWQSNKSEELLVVIEQLLNFADYSWPE
jgi:predicted ATP-dependent serine protease